MPFIVNATSGLVTVWAAVPADKFSCPKCKGTGTFVARRDTIVSPEPCFSCSGRGWVATKAEQAKVASSVSANRTKWRNGINPPAPAKAPEANPPAETPTAPENNPLETL